MIRPEVLHRLRPKNYVPHIFLADHGLEDLITVVVEVKVLRDHSHNGNHGKTAIVDFSVLVADPSLLLDDSRIERGQLEQQ